MSSDVTSNRRILSRTKINDEESSRQSRNLQVKTEPKIISSRSPITVAPVKTDLMDHDTSLTLTSHQQQQQHSLAISYINKESFNEDIEIEESTLINDQKWRGTVIDALKEKILEMRALRADSTDTKAMRMLAYRQGLLLCASVKKLNRVANMRVNRARNMTHEEKNKIDEHHLELQNLLYEISHLQVEINKCLEFRSADEDVSLVDIESFYSNAPPEISKPEETRLPENVHKLKLARLDWELKERQNMLSRIKDLEKQIEERDQELKNKQNKLESLNPKLNQILEACKPTLEYFNTNFEASAVFTDSVQCLPKPLYQLYMMITAHRDTVDKEISVEVCGNIEEAKRFDTTDLISFEDDESDSGDDDNETEYKKKKAKDKASKRKQNNREKLFKTFPLSCKLHMQISSYGELVLEFFYLNYLKIVAVRIETSLGKENSLADCALLRSDNMFHCLYPKDNGAESPNIANKYLFSNTGIKSIEAFMKPIGIPYKWCQVLCGLYYGNKPEKSTLLRANHDSHRPEYNGEPKKSNGKCKEGSMEGDLIEIDQENSDDDEEESDLDQLDLIELKNKNESKLIVQILNRLKSRFKARVNLQKTINNTKNSNVSNPRLRIQSSLVSCRESSFEKFTSFSYTQHLLDSSLQINECDCVFYEILLLNSAAKLQAQVAINLDYPRVAPLFAINIHWKQQERNFINDEAIRDMERELNLYRENYLHDGQTSGRHLRRSLSKISLEDKNYSLFANQINHLLVCFDIYLESESYFLQDNEYQRMKLFPQTVRGRDRKRPYSYLASRDMFVQRMQFSDEGGKCVGEKESKV